MGISFLRHLSLPIKQTHTHQACLLYLVAKFTYVLGMEPRALDMLSSAIRVTALTLAFVYLFVSEVESHCIPQAGLELLIVWSQPPQYCSLLAESLEMKSISYTSHTVDMTRAGI